MLDKGTARTAEKNASKLSQDVTVGSTSPYYAIDGSKISSTTAYVHESRPLSRVNPDRSRSPVSSAGARSCTSGRRPRSS